MVREARLELAHLAALEPKSSASTNFATPAESGGYGGIRTCDPIIMSDVLYPTEVHSHNCKPDCLAQVYTAIVLL